MQRGKTGHYGSKRLRNLGIAIVGNMHPSVHQIVVHLQMECLLHLHDRARELDPHAPFAHFANLQSATLKPAGHLQDVGVGWPVQLAKFLGMKPVVKVCRGGVVLALVERRQLRLLLRAALQDQDDLLEQLAGIHAPHVELSPRRGNRVACQFLQF